MPKSSVQYFKIKEIESILRGITVRLGDDGRTLLMFKNGRPFRDFLISATPDCRSGRISVSGRLVYSWEAQKNPGYADCWEHRMRDFIRFVDRVANK